jgi:hypothetical protein
MNHDEFDDEFGYDDESRLPGVFDPDDWYYGTPPPLDIYLSWTDHSPFARRLILLIARIDLKAMQARAAWHRLLERRNTDEIPF